ncbi:hypothetical protein GCM10010965_11280 [Caldalkalibacillus thermarum]|nr:hypothetical protein GCM10010965_11280 [Caldalkalibacillus thermarum]
MMLKSVARACKQISNPRLYLFMYITADRWDPIKTQQEQKTVEVDKNETLVFYLRHADPFHRMYTEQHE